jgi:hypothetical protein
MAEAADTEDGDKVAGLCWRISQSVERGDTCTEKGCSVCRRHAVRDRHESTRFCDHHFGISPIAMNAGIFLVAAIHEIAVAAKLAIPTRASEESNTDPLTDFPTLHAGPDSVDSPDD